jgi:hypothetical protein
MLVRLQCADSYRVLHDEQQKKQMNPINKVAALVVSRRWKDTRDTAMPDPKPRTKAFWRADLRSEMVLKKRTAKEGKPKQTTRKETKQ